MIRAVEHAEKSGNYIVKLHNYTSHEGFQRTLENALNLSDDAKVYAKSEGLFKFFTIKLSQTALEEVACRARLHSGLSKISLAFSIIILNPQVVVSTYILLKQQCTLSNPYTVYIADVRYRKTNGKHAFG